MYRQLSATPRAQSFLFDEVNRGGVQAKVGGIKVGSRFGTIHDREGENVNLDDVLSPLPAGKSSSLGS